MVLLLTGWHDFFATQDNAALRGLCFGKIEALFGELQLYNANVPNRGESRDL